LFSVSSAIANPEKDTQALATSQVISMPNVELAVTGQIEIPTATTMMMEHVTTVDQTATMTGVDQMTTAMAVDQQTVTMTVVGQPAPGTAMDPAATGHITEISNSASSIYPDTTTGKATTIDRKI
jgi:hypothetical protein